MFQNVACLTCTNHDQHADDPIADEFECDYGGQWMYGTPTFVKERRREGLSSTVSSPLMLLP
jgi:hypothetical protein